MCSDAAEGNSAASSRGILGVSDGIEGVQWNAGYRARDGTVWLGVNLEGIKYDDWPVARLIEREFSRPLLPTRLGGVSRHEMPQAWDNLEGLHELARCRSKPYDHRRRVLIVIHGSDRNGDPCFETGLSAAAAAGEAAATGIVAMPKGASRFPSPGDDGAGRYGTPAGRCGCRGWRVEELSATDGCGGPCRGWIPALDEGLNARCCGERRAGVHILRFFGNFLL